MTYPTEDGTCIRDYIHVTDFGDADWLALEHSRRHHRSGVYNLGNGRGFSVKEVIETVRDVTGQPIQADISPRRSGDPAILIASPERAIRELNWKPKYDNLHTIVETAWKWHKAHPNGYGD